MIKSILRVLVYPLLVGGNTVFAGFILMSPITPMYAYAGVLPITVLVIILERVIPVYPSWNRSHKDILVDLCHLLVSTYVVTGVTAFLCTGVLAPWWRSQVSQVIPHLLDGPLYYTFWPALLLADFGGYWSHRWMHRTWIWPIHATHHSALRLYWLNANRNHPLDALFFTSFSLLPLVVLCAPEPLMTLISVFATTHAMFQHSNIDTRLGIFRGVISAGEAHRWHHSTIEQEAETNYGNLLLVWDKLFGTWFVPNRPSPEHLGLINDEPYPENYWRQITAPFTKKHGYSTTK